MGKITGFACDTIERVAFKGNRITLLLSITKYLPMKYIIFTLTFLLAAYNCQSQIYSWSKGLGGNVGDDAARASYVDAAGNVYITGIFHNTIDFVVGGGASFTSVGGGDVFVVKYDANGTYQWARTFGGTGTGAASTLDDYGYAVKADAAGNVYVTGFFQNTVDFNPANPNTTVFTSVGLGDMFIVKYDAGGLFQWAKQVGGVNQQIGYGLALDATGSIFISGAFVGAADFNPDPSGVATLTAYSTGYDGFLAKYDNNGNYIFAYKFGSTAVNNADNFWNVDVDASGNVYAIGYYAGTIDFNPGAATNNISTVSATLDVIVAKYDNAGNYIWAKNMGGTVAEYGRSIRVDTSGHFYITGYFNGTVDFNPGAATNNLVSAGLTDIFLAKYDTSGAYIWAKKMGGTGNDNGWQLDIDNNNQVYLTGYFSSATANFNPAGTANLVNPGGGTAASATADAFLAVYDTSGAYLWANRIGDNVSTNDFGYGVSVDPATGKISASGAYSGTADFDFDIPVAAMTSNGGTDIYVAQYGQTGFPLSIFMSRLSGYWKNGKAVLSWTAVQEANDPGFEIEYSVDGKTFRNIGQVVPVSPFNVTSEYSFIDPEASAQRNYYRVKTINEQSQIVYSNTVQLERTNMSAGYTIYPNPAKNALLISVKDQNLGVVTVSVINMNGQILFVNRYPVNGSQPISVNTAGLASGTYQLRLEQSGKEEMFRFIK
jgi:hypothetical protein